MGVVKLGGLGAPYYNPGSATVPTYVPTSLTTYSIYTGSIYTKATVSELQSCRPIDRVRMEMGLLSSKHEPITSHWPEVGTPTVQGGGLVSWSTQVVIQYRQVVPSDHIQRNPRKVTP